MQWRIGEVTITSVVEQPLTDLAQLIPGATAEVIAAHAWLRPDFVAAGGDLLGVVQAFVVRTPQTLIVVDCCAGNDKESAVMPQWRGVRHDFLDRLAAAGVNRDEVDVVLCTHLHLDHVGWNTMRRDGAWLPTFPQARYLFARREYQHHLRELGATPACRALGIDPETLMQAYADPRQWAALLAARGLHFEQLMGAVMDLTVRQTDRDSIAPIIDAGLADLVAVDHRIDAQVRLVPSHGHTPGHVSVRIESGGRSALITGDAIHHPLQIAVPELATLADSDPQAAVATRRRLLAELADTETLLIGTHFAPPTAGLVRQGAPGYRLLCGTLPESEIDLKN